MNNSVQNNKEKRNYMKIFEKVALIFTIIGAVNWGLIGAFDFNLVKNIFPSTMLQDIIYMIVGICGLINIGILFMDFKED
jgi:uncharacterized protein